MELTYNNGTAFFYIESPDFVGATKDMKSVNKMISEDVISFSFSEEMGKLTSGSLTLRDPTGVYARVLRTGLKFVITFGYKTWNQDLKTLGIDSKLAKGMRQGLTCIITTPSGSSDENGQVTYTVGFHSLEILGDVKHIIYDSGTLKDVVSGLLDELDVTEKIIDFKMSSENLNSSIYLSRRENTFEFLRIVAKDLGCYFMLGRTPSGGKVAVFVDYSKLDSSSVKKFLSSVLAITSQEQEFYYNSGQISNVKSYNWQQHVGESGTGDSVQMSYVNGKVIFDRRIAKGETVKLWRLNNDKVADYLHSKGSISDEIQAVGEIANAKDFSQVEKFFDEVKIDTAPQGMGYTVNLSVHGNPYLIVLTEVKFKTGFPAPLTQSIPKEALTKFYIKKTSHTFSKGEYITDLEVVDSYTLNGSFVAPQRGDLTPK